MTQDLGRHITNGKILLETGNLVSTNFYSYTEPTMKAVNHHWLTGVLFYEIHKFFNFTGLSIFYLVISGLTIFIFFITAKYKSNFVTALLVTFFLLPLLSQRKEVRPEGLSYLFLAIYYYLLTLYIENKITFKKILPIIFGVQIIWVNSHIFFIFGIFLTGAFCFEEFIKVLKEKNKVRFFQLLSIVGATVVASLFNPYGLEGLLEPLNIFKNYGYMIVENQSVFFMQKIMPSFVYIYTELMALIFIIFTINKLYEKKTKLFSADFLITAVFMVLAFKIIRIIPIFAMFLVPYFSKNLNDALEENNIKISPYVLLIIFISLIPSYFFSAIPKGSGLGLVPNINTSADVYKMMNLKGPIFNNYDIGGYLIYHLYPKEKVFVDNRPEAYSINFFKNTYIPMQENNDKWEEFEGKYNFNTIYFYRLDITPWAQTFLINRIKDDSWVPIFVDEYSIILVKNNEVNKEIIQKLALPREMFTVVK